MPTGIPSTHPVLPALREAVEQKFGKSLRQQNNIWDFIGTIQNRLNEDTIRRLWGLRKDGYRSIRPATLDILCEYIGAKDWQSFVAAYQQQAQIESELNPHTRQITADDLQPGDQVLLTWLPNRECVAEYLGDGEFCIVRIEHSRTLRVGDRFRCRVFAAGEPLYWDALVRDGKVLGGYRIGKCNGVSNVQKI